MLRPLAQEGSRSVVVRVALLLIDLRSFANRAPKAKSGSSSIRRLTLRAKCGAEGVRGWARGLWYERAR